MQMSVGLLDHSNVSTRKLKETDQFYENVLGFVNSPRPQFNFPGAWLYSAGQPCCTLTTFPRRTWSSARIQASSITSRLAAVALKQ
jgi:catechol 2,3-dioxygenase-like lactoylglutathione lyase family enzyme